jgi:hypothetical protein
MVDFSDSQQIAMKRAMGRIELECRSGDSLINLDGVAANVHETRTDALCLQKGEELFHNERWTLEGCIFHWMQSVKKVKTAAKFVDHKDQEKWVKMVEACRTAKSTAEFKAAEKAARDAFPRAEDWFDWWTNPLHGSLIFESMKPQAEGSDAAEDSASGRRKPRTNNVSESNNRDQKRTAGKTQMTLAEAVTAAFCYTNENAAKVTRPYPPAITLRCSRNNAF